MNSKTGRPCSSASSEGLGLARPSVPEEQMVRTFLAVTTIALTAPAAAHAVTAFHAINPSSTFNAAFDARGVVFDRFGRRGPPPLQFRGARGPQFSLGAQRGVQREASRRTPCRAARTRCVQANDPRSSGVFGAGRNAFRPRLADILNAPFFGRGAAIRSAAFTDGGLDLRAVIRFNQAIASQGAPQAAAVPAPATLPLAASTVIGFGFLSYRRRQRRHGR